MVEAYLRMAEAERFRVSFKDWHLGSATIHRTGGCLSSLVRIATRAGQRDRLDKADRLFGMIAANGQQVVRDAGQEAVSQAGNRQLPNNFPTITGLVEPMEKAIDPGEVEFFTHPKSRWAEPLQLAARQVRPALHQSVAGS